MGRKPVTVAIARGSGLVARFGDVVVYILRETAFTERILGAAEAAAAAADPGTAVVQRLVTVVFGDKPMPASFGVVAPTTGGMLVLLRGTVAADIAGPEGARRLSGTRAMTWLDEIVREPVGQIALGADGDDTSVTAVPHTDLRSGVVPGGGVVVHAPVRGAGTPEPDRPPEQAASSAAHTGAAEPEPTTWVPFPADEVHSTAADSEPPPARRPAGGSEIPRPTSTPPAVTRAAETPAPAPSRPAPALPPRRSAPQAVRNTPDGPNSSRIEIPTETATVGPAHGSLSAPGGASYPLDRPYVIGRDPMAADAVRRADASPIVLSDRQVSRVHAHITLDQGAVLVQDSSTPGGTFIAAPGAEEWTRLGARPAELKPGWSLRIGTTILTYRPSR
jgi:hypothetical protein